MGGMSRRAGRNGRAVLVQVFFVFGDFYKFFETDRIIFREMLLNLGYAMLGIVIISVLLLISPRAVVTIVLCIAVVDLFLFAEMWLFNIRCAVHAPFCRPCSCATPHPPYVCYKDKSGKAGSTAKEASRSSTNPDTHARNTGHVCNSVLALGPALHLQFCRHDHAVGHSVEVDHAWVGTAASQLRCLCVSLMESVVVDVSLCFRRVQAGRPVSVQ